MKMLSIQELSQFSTELNLFSHSKLPAPQLIEAKLLPPLPVSGKVLIWGFHILEIASAMKIESLACEEFDGNSLDFLAAALNLEDRVNNYSWTEKVNIYKYLTANKLLDKADDISQAVQSESSFVNRVVRFNKLPPHICRLVETSIIDLKTAENVSDLPLECCLIFTNYSENFTVSQRRIILKNLRESGKRDNLNPEDLSQLFSTVMKSENPLNESTLRRYPKLSLLKEEFSALNNKYTKGSGIRLNAPDNFEGGVFNISFSYRNGKQLGKIISALTIIQEAEDEFFSLLQ